MLISVKNLYITDIYALINFIENSLNSYRDTPLNDNFLLMEGGSSSGGGFNSEGGQPGGSEPGGNGPKGTGFDIQDTDSSDVKRRKRMAWDLQLLLNEELGNRSGYGYRHANLRITMSDLNIVNFRSTNLTLPSVSEFEREILQYRKDFPDAFNDIKIHKKKGPGTTLVKDVIFHILNNKK